MTKLLEKAIAKVKELPEERQDEAAEFLMNYAEDHLSLPTAAQLEGIQKAQAAMRRGEFATDEDVAAMKRRHDL